jgi:hypothetical protein
MTRHRLIANLLSLGLAAPAAGQQAEPPAAGAFVAARIEAQAGTAMTFHSAIESRVTAGRPYSAEATTEFLQVLGDGNRIARKTSVRIFRDGEGRTRREELGSEDSPESISIYDPVAHATYVLDPRTRTAHKSAVRIVYPAWKSAGSPETVVMEDSEKMVMAGKIALVPPTEMAVQVVPEPIGEGKAAGSAKAIVVPRSRMMMSRAIGVQKGETESLGRQVIEGVAADGTRITTVIPAGAIGNQQEIRVVSEQWFSPDLQVLVMTKHSDPRSGETTYRLSNVIRGEPGAGMFDVPPDYTIRESPFMRTPEPK